MDQDDNLMIALHRWAHRQDENYTTEAFVYVMKHLQKYRPLAVSRVLAKLTGSVINIPPEKVSEVKFVTQPRIDDAIPDIKIASPGCLVYVEVKVSSSLERKQVIGYLDSLAKSDCYPNIRLVLLTKYPIVAETSEGTLPRRWHQVAEWLKDETLTDSTSQQTRLLVEQFLDFLRYQHATVVQIRTGISQGLASYQKNHPSDSVLTRRIRSLAPLAADQDLQPLHDLLMMMDEVLLHLGVAPQPRLDSGKQHDGWIGYNLNNSEYFFHIYLTEPEHVVFETFRRVIKNPSPAPEDQFVTKYQRKCWINKLDLASSSMAFFSRDEVQQKQLLEDFLKQCLKTAESMSDPVDPSVTTTWQEPNLMPVVD